MGLDSFIIMCDDPEYLIKSDEGHLVYNIHCNSKSKQIAHWRKEKDLHEWFANYYADMINSDYTDFNSVYCPIDNQLLFNLKADLEDGYLEQLDKEYLSKTITTCLGLLAQKHKLYFSSWY